MKRKGFTLIELIIAVIIIGILASLAHGFWIGHDKVYVEGIRHVSQMDIQVARELGYTIKLLAIIKAAGNAVEVRVHPTLIPHRHVTANARTKAEVRHQQAQAKQTRAPEPQCARQGIPVHRARGWARRRNHEPGWLVRD